MKKYITIMTGVLLFLCFTAVECQDPDIWVKYIDTDKKEQGLDWRQVKSLMACRIIKQKINVSMENDNTIGSKNNPLDLADLIEKVPSYVKDNILDLIYIFPSACWESLDDYDKTLDTVEKNQKSLNLEIYSLLFDKEIYEKKSKQSSLYGLIQCAHYLDSPVINDLIEYALKQDRSTKYLAYLNYNNIHDESGDLKNDDLYKKTRSSVVQNSIDYKNKLFIDKKVLELPDLTFSSLDRLRKLDRNTTHSILPPETVETFIKQQSSAHSDTLLINLIKQKYYELHLKKHQEWLNKNKKRLSEKDEWEVKLYKIEKFTLLSLEHKLNFLYLLQESINSTQEYSDKLHRRAEKLDIKKELLNSLKKPDFLLSFCVAPLIGFSFFKARSVLLYYAALYASAFLLLPPVHVLIILILYYQNKLYGSLAHNLHPAELFKTIADQLPPFPQLSLTYRYLFPDPLIKEKLAILSEKNKYLKQRKDNLEKMYLEHQQTVIKQYTIEE